MKKANQNKSKSKKKRSKSKKRNISWIQIVALITIGTALVFLAVKPNFSSRSGKSVNKRIEIPFKKEGELSFLSKQNQEKIKTIDIEIAEGQAETASGLMYRYSMSNEQGMLFIMEVEQAQNFWMKETYISLDIIFVNSDFEIVRIHKHAPALSEQNIPSIKKAKYVLEVNAGFCDKFGISEGDLIRYERQ
ncbi:DUF192 domain-containing protein [Marinifilum caeruleilacunae]|uniref:DUF192 domain-containing protein n=1 Tax=Marinifilum caeruleilacunae TaxID=2499076 RepID=A0ABX1WVT8_9BACT|nr:DUF192 domain-containing protein [Marinifilum caeruleilacunae]NOU60182.1 DUF192 domain-containing protein [Marinifilum caeruleilacunae]